VRADQALVARGLAGSRTLAVRLIAAGSVRLETGHGARLVLKPSEQIGGDALLRVDTSDPMLRYVSRGGLKLEAALRRLAELDRSACLDWPDAVALDVGLSTGGFADCLLRHGVGQVVGVDVGHGQLHSSLVGRPRLRAFEGVNARFLDAAALGDAMPLNGFQLITVDLSFISLASVLPAVTLLLKPAGWLVALVKPQFELGPQGRDRHGVVRDSTRYAPLLAQLAQQLSGLVCPVRDTLPSPLLGGDGNREFFLLAQRAEPEVLHDPSQF
jgi:23S rRNA (cytidine1920-2'-O)/16S rRNA (cytidine1409-2'-O)-methyltransferase